jgi:Protein of unknown function (DUF4446)
MDELTTTPGIVAVAAAAVAAVALILAVALAVRLRRLRSAQSTVLGDRGNQDLVAHAAGLQSEFLVLRDYVDELAARLDDRMRQAEARLDGTIAHRALVRYDAYGELSGQQSTSIALLDAGGSGLVLSSILHRDHARLYAKAVQGGEGEHELSPEEADAVRIALEGGARASR